MKDMEGSLKDRKTYIDTLRIIACLFVIFNHTNERGFFRFLSDRLGSFVWGFHLVISIMCKSAVPIFFMISGSMLLRKEESLAKTYQRIPKILIDLILFSYIYISLREVISFPELIQRIVEGSYWHLWYLYAYIAFIVTLPFLRKIVISLDAGSGCHLFSLAFIVMGVFPIVESFGITINGHLKPSWISCWVFVFPVLGYLIDVKLDIKKVTFVHILGMWLLNGICIVVSAVSEYYFLLREPGSADERFLSNFCIVNAVTLFLTAKYVFCRITIKDAMNKWIVEVGKSTFGIYLIHIWILWESPFYEYWMMIEQNRIFGKYGGIYVEVVLVFVIAGILIRILQHIPIIRKAF